MHYVLPFFALLASWQPWRAILELDVIGVALIGTGAIALANHVPGLRYCAHEVKLVSLCDSDAAALARASASTGVTRAFEDWRHVIDDPAVDAVIIATPNFTHAPIALAAVAAGKHVLCEKPLALDASSAMQMYDAALRAGVRHMTAFTYRFVPAMRYMKHLIDRGEVGTPYHFRARRFQDWADRSLGWRQVKKLAGSGELADMLSHRIDYAHHLLGPMRRLVADLRSFVPVRQGAASDVDDWVAMLVEFDRAAHTTGVLESTKLATGRGEGHRGADDVEINGADGTIVYSTQDPLRLRVGGRGDLDLHAIDVPREFQVWPGSKRDPAQGDPLVTFRYDQNAEFIDAIVNSRPCSPSFYEGVMAQAVMDAAIESAQQRRWIELRYPKQQ
jgi:predicted dehydrogenase